jgi:hypothetical protein
LDELSLYRNDNQKALLVTEDPIKLFGTRTERYPEPTDADIAHGAAKATLAAIPILGGPATEVLSMVLAPPVTRRRDTWFKELADALEDLEGKVEGFRIRDLEREESFVSAVIQATRSAISTHQREKLDALRNAILNIALSKTPDEEKEIFFLNLIESFSITHLEILRLFANPQAYPPTRRTELRDRRQLTDPMVLDLNDRGLLVDPRPYVARTRESTESLTQVGWTLSPMGNDFLLFIALPAPLK